MGHMQHEPMLISSLYEVMCTTQRREHARGSKFAYPYTEWFGYLMNSFSQYSSICMPFLLLYHVCIITISSFRSSNCMFWSSHNLFFFFIFPPDHFHWLFQPPMFCHTLSSYLYSILISSLRTGSFFTLIFSVFHLSSFSALKCLKEKQMGICISGIFRTKSWRKVLIWRLIFHAQALWIFRLTVLILQGITETTWFIRMIACKLDFWSTMIYECLLLKWDLGSKGINWVHFSAVQKVVNVINHNYDENIDLAENIIIFFSVLKILSRFLSWSPLKTASHS
jgi:hypothetical protein